MFFFEHHGLDGKDFYRANKLQDTSFPAHLHRAYELIYLHSGALLLQVEQRQYTLRAGDLAFIFCNQIHSFSSPLPSDITVVLFSPEMVGAFYAAYKGHVPQNNVLPLQSAPQFYSLQTLYAQKGLLYRLCDELLRATRLVPVGNQPGVAVLQQIFAYVDHHYHTPCTLKTVARALQYDYAYLSKLFTRLSGMHFTEYLNNYRIAQACYLLQSGNMPVSDIAARCGYATLRTFHRNFQATMNCSPRQYLTRHSGELPGVPAR